MVRRIRSWSWSWTGALAVGLAAGVTAGCSSTPTDAVDADAAAVLDSVVESPSVASEVPSPLPSVSKLAQASQSPSAAGKTKTPSTGPVAAPGGGSSASKDSGGASKATQAPKTTTTPTKTTKPKKTTEPKGKSKVKAPVTSNPAPTAKPDSGPTTIPKQSAPAKVVPRLTVSRTMGLSNGDRVTVSGSGFDTTKGIYVAYCVKPDSGQAPGPCGGGADTDGSSAASEWISSNPPPYGKQLAIPYGANGSFTVTIRVTDAIGSVDCGSGQCAIAARADHTRSSDRSQDVMIPVRFS